MALEVLATYLSVTSILLAGVCCVAGYIILSWLFTPTPKNLPPGPKGWTKISKLMNATKNDAMHLLAWEWAEEFGPVTFFYNFGQPIAFLNNADISRRLLSSDEYKNALADRVPTYGPRLAWFNGKDLFFTPFDVKARKKRRMFHNIIGLYGDGVEQFETVINGEMDRFMKELDQHEGEDIELWRNLGRSLKCVLYILALGKRPPDMSTPDVLENYDLAINKLWSPDVDFVLNYMPILSKFPGRYKTLVNDMMSAKALAEDLMYHRPRESYVPGKPRGMADLLFEEASKPGNEWMAEDPEHMIAFLTSLFLAAHLTSRATIMGIFLSLLNYPDVRKRVQEEIDTVIGDRRPRVEDRGDLPYTEACILETLRSVAQVALSSYRTSTMEISIDGMTFPKGTLFIINQWYLLHDERTWEDPWTFKPERFLDSRGQILPADHPLRKNLIPFGLGLRACPGEVFARSRVFLFVTNILQKYDLLPPQHGELVNADFRNNDDKVKGFVRQVRPFTCRLQKRKKREE